MGKKLSSVGNELLVPTQLVYPYRSLEMKALLPAGLSRWIGAILIGQSWNVSTLISLNSPDPSQKPSREMRWDEGSEISNLQTGLFGH